MSRERRPAARARPAGRPPGRGRRLIVFVAVAVLLVGGLGAYLLVRHNTAQAQAAADAAQDARRPRLAVPDVLKVPHFVVRNTEDGPSYGKIALVPLSDPAGPRAIVGVSCERVAAVPSGAICLQKVSGLVTSYRAVFLDAQMRETGSRPVGGVPSRARMSADGGYAASTVFVTGHSYVDASFSTETVIYEGANRTPLGNLETWTTTNDGDVVTAQDRNFWGVSFIGDGPGFYATMATGGKRYILRGDITTRSMTVLGPEGACPSVGPDARTVAFKQADPVSRADHFVAMDVATSTITRLPEGRSVDDHVNWLDDDTVIYAVGKGVASSVHFDVWSASVSGTPARLVVPDAFSPSVVRP